MTKRLIELLNISVVTFFRFFSPILEKNMMNSISLSESEIMYTIHLA